MKILVDNYTFDASAKTITFNDYVSIKLEQVRLVTHVLTGTIIFNFAKSLYTGTVATNVLTLTYDTSAMSDADPLAIDFDDLTVPSSGGDATAANQASELTALALLDTDLDSVNTNLGTLHTDNGTIETKLDTLHTDNGTVETKLDTLHADLNTTVHGDLTSTNTKLDTLHTDNGTIESKLDTVNTNLGTVATDIVNVHTDTGTTLHNDLTTLIADTGATTAAAVVGDVDGSISQRLRGISKMFNDIWDSVNHFFKVGLTYVGSNAISVNNGNHDNGTIRFVQATDQPTLTNAQPVYETANVAGGYTPGKLISAASTNATNIKNAQGKLGYLTVTNINASPRYLKLFNKATSPTVGTDVPVHTFGVPGNTSLAGSNIPIPAGGINLSNGIGLALTTGVGDSDTGAVAANEIVVNYGII